MKYHLLMQPPALDELDQAYANAAKHAPETAARWLERFRDALTTLQDNPQRFVLAPENELVDYEIRQFDFGRRTGAFRVLFTIVDETVRVLHIRRAVRDTMKTGEIECPKVEE